jgi:hypothetical protein
MLNACLTFSWPNIVPFDREAGRLFGPSGLPAIHCTGAGVVGHGDAMIRPKSSRTAPGTCGSWQTRYFTWMVDSMTNISLSGWVRFVWRINYQLVNNRFESSSFTGQWTLDLSYFIVVILMEHLDNYMEYDMMEVVNDHWLSLLV